MIRQISKIIGHCLLAIGFLTFGYDGISSILQKRLITTRWSDLFATSLECKARGPLPLLGPASGYDSVPSFIFDISPWKAVMTLWMAPTCLMMGSCLVLVSTIWLRQLPRQRRCFFV